MNHKSKPLGIPNRFTQNMKRSRMRGRAPAACLAAILAAGIAGAAAQRAEPGDAAPSPVAGWVETAYLVDHGLSLDAKLDTGAATSSLDAGIYETFSRGGRAWVRFTLKGNNQRRATIETPVLRTAHIRRAGTGLESRPVVLLRLCIAGRTADAEFTLADRAGMAYPLLVGRSFLAGRLAVDSGKTFTGASACETAAGR
ncbi:MAG TPA: RimK/LysX family protein [Gammaproteobacteria bacterium]|nr:RimK/LysX family protein [Gammaproteobacteria bacterium]